MLFVLIFYLGPFALGQKNETKPDLLAQAQDHLRKGQVSIALYNLELYQKQYPQPQAAYFQAAYWKIKAHAYRYHYNQALDYGLQTLYQAQQSQQEPWLIASLQIQLGQAYQNLNLLDSAQYYTQLAQEQFKQLKPEQYPQIWPALIQNLAQQIPQSENFAQTQTQLYRLLKYLPPAEADLAQNEIQFQQARYLLHKGQTQMAQTQLLQLSRKPNLHHDLYWQICLHLARLAISPQTHNKNSQNLAQRYGKRSLPWVQVQLEWLNNQLQQGRDSNQAPALLYELNDILSAEQTQGYKTRTLHAQVSFKQAQLSRDSNAYFFFINQTLNLLYPQLKQKLSRHQVKALTQEPPPLSAFQVLAVLESKVEYYLQLSQTQTNYLPQAKEHLQVLGQVLSDLDPEYLNPQQREQRYKLQHRWLRHRWEVLKQLYANQAQPKLLNEWLNLIEEHHRLSISNYLLESQSLRLSNLSPLLLQQHQQHRSEIYRLSARWSLAQQEADTSYALNILSQLQQHQQQLEGLRELLRREAPLYQDWRGTELNIYRLRKQLNPQQACLLAHQSQGYYYLFAILKDTVYIDQGYINPENFEEERQQFQQTLLRAEGKVCPLKWTKRYLPFDSLFQAKNIETLLILPSGELEDLPYEFFEVRGVPSRYAMERYQIDYPLSIYRLFKSQPQANTWRQGIYHLDLPPPYLHNYWTRGPWPSNSQALFALSHYSPNQAPPLDDLAKSQLLVIEHYPLGSEGGFVQNLRPYQALKAQAVLAPRWQSDSLRNQRFLTWFYEGLALGLNPAQAWHRAQLQGLEAGWPPLHWGNYQLLGQSQNPLSLGHWYYPLILYLLLSLSLAALMYRPLKRKLNRP